MVDSVLVVPGQLEYAVERFHIDNGVNGLLNSGPRFWFEIKPIIESHYVNKINAFVEKFTQNLFFRSIFNGSLVCLVVNSFSLLSKYFRILCFHFPEIRRKSRVPCLQHFQVFCCLACEGCSYGYPITSFFV